MTTPTTVKKSADKAREMIKQHQAAKTDDSADTETLAPPAEPSAPASDAEKTGQEDTPPAAAQTTTETQTEPAPAQKQEDGTDWKTAHDQLQHKYSVLQGKYNAEVPRLTEKIRQLEEHLNNSAQAKQQGEEGEGATPPVDMSQIDPEQFRDYGDEFVGMAHMLKQIAGEVGSVKQDVGSVKQGAQAAEQAAAEAYWTRVYQGVPNFEEVNNAPEFFEWLNGYQQTPQGIRLRNSVLQEAHAAGRADDVVQIFQEYLKEEATTNNQSPASEPAASSQKQNISPPASASTPVTPPDDKPVYSRSQVDKFFTDLSHGKFRHNNEWAQAEKQRILAAGREGRIQ
ncbi:MAG: hypothetical protein SVM79_00020 [Chloroflexota bacterium]|nr:hypothetical protein [Chloroflexota bacterium]